MPFALILIGVILAVSAYRDTTSDLFNIIKDVFGDAKGFAYWVLASIILGFLASVDSIRQPVNAFMILLMVVLVIRKRGTFDQLNDQLFR